MKQTHHYCCRSRINQTRSVHRNRQQRENEETEVQASCCSCMTKTDTGRPSPISHSKNPSLPHCCCTRNRADTHSLIKLRSVGGKNYEQFSEEGIEEPAEILEKQTNDIEENVHEGNNALQRSKRGRTKNSEKYDFKKETPDNFLDRWIRGAKRKTKFKAVYNSKTLSWYLKPNSNWDVTEDPETWNQHNVRYDRQSHRWYLKLDVLDVKEIRAKVWQYELDKE